MHDKNPQQQKGQWLLSRMVCLLRGWYLVYYKCGWGGVDSGCDVSVVDNCAMQLCRIIAEIPINTILFYTCFCVFCKTKVTRFRLTTVGTKVKKCLT